MPRDASPLPTLLVVDDSSTLRAAVRIALRGGGYAVEEAVDGRQALALLDGRRYDLVISDVNMPHLDGFGFVEAMKRVPRYRDVPVVMLTVGDSAEARARGRAAGARAWMVKPFEAARLLQVVATLVAA